MCGRFVSPEEAEVERFWHLGRHNKRNPFAGSFNVFPTDTIQFLRLPSNSDEIELAAGRWGLVPHWWKEAKLPGKSFNARIEEAAVKPMWRDAWSRSRCLIPALGWYEWQPVEKIDPATGEVKAAKQPHFN
ncbi:MAG TPA: SOS response-associated peptidase family protein, partial [Burkholderiales bacterium]